MRSLYMKKIKVLLAFTLFVSLVFVGCNKKEDTTISSNARAELDKTIPTVRLITDATGIDDKSFNAATWRGILEFYGDTWENMKGRGVYYDFVTCQSQDMYVPTLKQVSDEGYDLIITNGFTFADALAEVAALYPNQKYMIADVDYVNLPNVMNCVFTEEQGSYLVGVVAAMQAQLEGIQNPRFGFIGGVPGATITKFEMGYIQGIRSVLPNAPIVDYYANDWGKPELAKTQAKNWYDSGVYAIFSAAGGTGNGTIAQAKEYRMQGKNVWAIGVDSDQYEDGIYDGKKSAVLTSMLKRVENSAKLALNNVKANAFVGKVYTLTMEQNGVGASAANPELRAEIIEALKTISSDISSGKIKISATYADALQKGLVPQGLGAKDN